MVYAHVHIQCIANLLSNLVISGETVQHLHVLIGQTGHGGLVVFPHDVVGLDDSGKDREPIGSVQGTIVVVGVHTCQVL